MIPSVIKKYFKHLFLALWKLFGSLFILEVWGVCLNTLISKFFVSFSCELIFNISLSFGSGSLIFKSRKLLSKFKGLFWYKNNKLFISKLFWIQYLLIISLILSSKKQFIIYLKLLLNIKLIVNGVRWYTNIVIPKHFLSKEFAILSNFNFSLNSIFLSPYLNINELKSNPSFLAKSLKISLINLSLSAFIILVLFDSSIKIILISSKFFGRKEISISIG